MSRAERRVVPAAPRLGRALRDAVGDLYYNSLRFVGANLLVGVPLVGVLLASAGTLLWLGLLLLVAIPSAGMMRMATTLVREGHTDLGDLMAVVRRPWLPLAVAASQLTLAGILAVDIAIGSGSASLPGSFLAASGAYGLVIGWALAVTAWPIILDPLRDGDPVRRRLRLAGLLLLAHPLRIGALAILLGAFVLAATLAIMPILTFALAYAWLVAARYVLPAADRLEGRATHEIGD